MEILTWVLEGELAHKDSTGGAETIKPGELQRMSAGTGIRHSEFNASQTAPVHLLQIWLLPNKAGLAPGYEQKSFDGLDGRLRLVASPDAADGSLTIHQDALLYVGRFTAGQTAALAAKKGRVQWVQVARGAASVNGIALQAGDGAAVQDEETLRIAANDPAEVLVFDMAG